MTDSMNNSNKPFSIKAKSKKNCSPIQVATLNEGTINVDSNERSINVEESVQNNDDLVEEKGDDEEKNQFEEFEFSFNKLDKIKAWESARHLTNRNSDLWRVDPQDNIILSHKFTKSSPLAYRTLVIKSDDSFSYEAVQSEYYGSDTSINHKSALKYRPKDQDQDDILSLIEIALLGNVSDENGESYCWCPSSIHQDLFKRNDAARRWHSKLFANNFKFGMAGHNLAFQHMGVGVKKVDQYDENMLNIMDQKNTFLFINNYQEECSQLIRTINFNDDEVERSKKIKNNWGLPVVASFIGSGAGFSFASRTPSLTLRPDRFVHPQTKLKSAITKKYTPKSTLSAASASASSSSTSSLPLYEQEWPSLSSTSASESEKKPTKKYKMPSSKKQIR